MDKIIVTYFSDKDFYHFNLPYGEWVINGKEYTNQNYKSEQITSKEKPVIFKIERKTIIKHYSHTRERMHSLSVEAYNHDKELLTNKSIFDDDDVITFNTLEDEFAYKKFMRDWQPVTEQQILKHRVETEVRHAMIEHDSPFIKSMFCIDQARPELVQVEFARFQKHVVEAWLKEHNVTDYDFPNHSHLEYFKIGKDYVFNGVRNEYNGHNPVRVMSFDDAEKLLEDEKKKIECKLYSVLCKIQAIPDVNVYQVVSEIEAVRKYLSDTAYGRVSKADIARRCNNDLQKIVTRLENLSKEAISGV
jgi:hypothetical protein